MKLQKLNRTLVSALLISGALGVASQAHALSLSPSVAGWTTSLLQNPVANLNGVALASLVGYSGTLGLVYKQDYNGSESGNAAGYYTTSFTLDANNDPSGATITQSGMSKISCPTCYLVVKDGNHPDYQYVFNLGSWNGTETITLSGFWEAPNQGAISNIAIWNLAEAGGGGGGTITPVPEADTYAMLLAGLGLVGFAARRKLSKTV